jgi:MFS family permease
MFGFLAILVQFFQVPARSGYGIGANATQTALLLLPGALLVLVAGSLPGRVSVRYGARVTMAGGCLLGALGLALMAVSHETALELVIWSLMVFFALNTTGAAMPTLILEHVPQELSGQSAGTNLVMRSVGSSVGTQVAAVFITASIGHSGLPAESGYVRAFGIEAAGCVAAACCVVFVGRARPGRARRVTPGASAAARRARSPTSRAGRDPSRRGPSAPS